MINRDNGIVRDIAMAVEGLRDAFKAHNWEIAGIRIDLKAGQSLINFVHGFRTDPEVFVLDQCSGQMTYDNGHDAFYIGLNGTPVIVRDELPEVTVKELKW